MPCYKSGQSPRQKAFPAAYIAAGRNGTQAAIDVGYGKRNANNTASKLLMKPEVRAEVDRLQAEANTKCVLDETYVIDHLMAMVKENTDPKATVKALELLGKKLQLWVDRSKVEMAVQGNVTYDVRWEGWELDENGKPPGALPPGRVTDHEPPRLFSAGGH